MRFLTIGYGGKSPTEFIERLKAHGVEWLVDVRLYPNRAHLGSFVKAKTPDKGIERILREAGIGYLSLPELGNPFLKEANWSESYARLLEAEGAERTQRLRPLTNKVFCLLCAEKDVNHCHRLQLAQYLLTHEPGLTEVEHL